MTAQFREIILYKGRRRQMASEPLEQYPGFNKPGVEFTATCTALWRGYQGTWKVSDDKLYLVHLEGQACIAGEDKEISVSTFFPGQKKVFADWFSGTIRIEQGRLLHYVHMGYASVYEEDLLLDFMDGLLVNSRIVKNVF